MSSRQGDSRAARERWGDEPIAREGSVSAERAVIVLSSNCRAGGATQAEDSQIRAAAGAWHHSDRPSG